MGRESDRVGKKVAVVATQPCEVDAEIMGS